ncbi:platelet glycoprotein 4 isoform X2 [Varanus komodoensis]|uniref:Platelet glycoprotein 4 n=1 Tax=Varanus komodoensis TaxID=61221 RepID=A0A8D2LVX0_VARKO|nr:platelet glycoprotein 4 isoform X2 [Varanus komodoensis]
MLKMYVQEVVIEDGTTAYQNWVVPGSAVYRQFWFFDVQNPDAVIKNGSQPVLEQKGPYTYRVRYLAKENITEHPDFTISYMQPNIVHFMPSMSIGTEDDNFTFVNLAVVAAPALYPTPLVQALMNMFVVSSKSKLLQTRSVKEILWGYKDPFLASIPKKDVPTTVGVFLPYNETFDGPYRVFTGKEDTEKTAIIQSYKNKSTVPYWDQYCNMVNGTDGASFPPFLNKEQVLYFFSSDICRSIYGLFDSEQVVKDITLYRFIVPPAAFASPREVPENICFCTEREISRDCTSAGALDISSCKAGKPVYITLPHFLYASEDVTSGVEGLSPNLQEHMTYLDVEPTTGFTLQFAKRLQVNLLVKPNSKITPLKKVQRPFLFPILWLNESAVISDEKAAFFRAKVTGKIKLLHLVEAVLIIVGSVMFLAFLVAFLICRTQKSK